MKLTQYVSYKLLAVFIIGIAIVLLLLAAVGPHEPSYAGRPLSDWVIEYYHTTYSRTDESEAVTTQRHDAARFALTQIGSNAAPFLLQWIRYDKPLWQIKAEPSLDKVLNILHIRRSNKKGRLASASPEAFGVIAPVLGEDIIAELQLLVNDFTHAVAHKRAILACSYLGARGAPVLIAAATNCPKSFQSSIINFMQNLGTNGRPAVPVIVKCLEEKARANGDLMDSRILEDCLLALAQIHSEPDTAIPALVPLLEDPRGNVAYYAATALGKYGPAAHSAVPALMKGYNSPACPDPIGFSNALWRIDPKSLGTIKPNVP